ncbi:MAG: apolipoprotein N-acyltransferase [Acidobacteriota bacterium]|nr:apolipoprotein N-acyltransferase [Acidobacteriota bacterium]
MYTRLCMQRASWKLRTAAVLSAALLELPFPLAGPMPPWRSIFAWFGLVPLLWAILTPLNTTSPRALRRAFLLSYLTGFLWYCGNCYWIRDTMQHYGDMPPLAPTLLLIAFSLVLGLYFGLFGLFVALVHRASGSVRKALLAAPILWVAFEFLAAHLTSVPWDQLGYSQVDNGLLTHLAPWTGVYGISFVLVCVNGMFVAPALLHSRHPRVWLFGIAGLGLAATGILRAPFIPPMPEPTATAVLIQPNLDVGGDNFWTQPEVWKAHIDEFTRLAGEVCGPYIAGIPQTGAPEPQPLCAVKPKPDLVAWPESPAPFFESEPRFQQAIVSIAHSVDAPLMVGSIGMNVAPDQRSWLSYNSALVIGADGQRVGRYDKIHLVPFGEYVPFKNLLFFARKLTGRVSEFQRGTMRKVFRLGGHRYGIFICYEAVFASEVRQFPRLGAEVLVNLSDDGWYGDTSAPWQHLNIARMRAIENRRWLLRDTNNGVTAVIDPYGRVRQSIPRHQVGVLDAKFAFRDDITFYTAHGDVFAWLCAILSIGLAIWTLKANLKLSIQDKVRS